MIACLSVHTLSEFVATRGPTSSSGEEEEEKKKGYELKKTLPTLKKKNVGRRRGRRSPL